MSCDWNVHCRTCGATHPFNDANHQEEAMHVLIKHAAAIAALVPLVSEIDVEFNLGYHYGRINPEWFAAHLDHELVPIDEYGRCADRCAELAACGSCGHRERCEKPLGHEGSHVAKERA